MGERLPACRSDSPSHVCIKQGHNLPCWHAKHRKPLARAFYFVIHDFNTCRCEPQQNSQCINSYRRLKKKNPKNPLLPEITGCHRLLSQLFSPSFSISSTFAMSKAAVKKLHWRSHVQDSFVPLLGSSGELAVAVGGGADYGEFPFVTSAPGGGLTVGDIILEVGGTPVLGMTLGDVRGVLNSCPHPIRIKTVSPGNGERCEVYRFFFSANNNVNVHNRLPHRYLDTTAQ